MKRVSALSFCIQLFTLDGKLLPHNPRTQQNTHCPYEDQKTNYEAQPAPFRGLIWKRLRASVAHFHPFRVSHNAGCATCLSRLPGEIPQEERE
jgi:hypothetical protein